MEKNVFQLVDHFFRHEYGRLVSTLTRQFSTGDIDLIEDAVQEALFKDSSQWAFQNVPDNPFAWLLRVAHNYVIDQFRKNNRQETYKKFVVQQATCNKTKLFINEEETIQDDLLKMIFACCHPAIPETDQIILSLKLLCGLSVPEIAKGLLKNQDAVKKSLTRAKKRFKSSIDHLHIPAVQQLTERLEVVMKVLYLMFNEGYTATEGSQLIRKDICSESIRLAVILYENEFLRSPQLSALLSLMYFKSARFDCRTDQYGNLLTLEEQDRQCWDQQSIALGLDFLMQSKSGEFIARFHLEAGIEGHLVMAPTYNSTDWSAILKMYDYLLKINPSPAVKLNRMVVFSEVYGAQKALKQLCLLDNDPLLAKNHLLYAIKADLLIKMGDRNSASPLLKKAVGLARNSIEKKFLIRKLANLR